MTRIVLETGSLILGLTVGEIVDTRDVVAFDGELLAWIEIEDAGNGKPAEQRLYRHAGGALVVYERQWAGWWDQVLVQCAYPVGAGALGALCPELAAAAGLPITG